MAKKNWANPVHFQRINVDQGTKNCKIKKSFLIETKRNQQNSHKTLMPGSGMWNVISKIAEFPSFYSWIKCPRSPVFEKFIHENRELQSLTRLFPEKKNISDQVQMTIQTLFYCFLLDRRSIWWVLSLTVCAEILPLKNLPWDNCLPQCLVCDRRCKNSRFSWNFSLLLQKVA